MTRGSSIILDLHGEVKPSPMITSANLGHRKAGRHDPPDLGHWRRCARTPSRSPWLSAHAPEPPRRADGVGQSSHGRPAHDRRASQRGAVRASRCGSWWQSTTKLAKRHHELKAPIPRPEPGPSSSGKPSGCWCIRGGLRARLRRRGRTASSRRTRRAARGGRLR